MNQILNFSLILIFSFQSALSLSAQSEIELIQSIRNKSNELLKSQNMEAELSLSTEDVLITTGAGTLLCGKASLKEYINNANSSKPMFWDRQTDSIEVNTETLLAWETGDWKGFDIKDKKEQNILVHGKYAAMWTKASGEWKIKSQLFVSLE